jgi:hypothetical protein
VVLLLLFVLLAMVTVLARLAARKPPLPIGPLTSRCAATGAASAGVVGGVVGLVVGLNVNPRTAWFAVFEVGIPAAIVGGLFGLFAGALLSVGRWLDHRAERSTLRVESTPAVPEDGST